MNSLLAYVGPETVLPAMSVLAAVAGVCLALGKWLTRPLVRGFHFLRGRSPDPATPASSEPVAAERGPTQQE